MMAEYEHFVSVKKGSMVLWLRVGALDIFHGFGDTPWWFTGCVT